MYNWYYRIRSRSAPEEVTQRQRSMFGQTICDTHQVAWSVMMRFTCHCALLVPYRLFAGPSRGYLLPPLLRVSQRAFRSVQTQTIMICVRHGCIVLFYTALYYNSGLLFSHSYCPPTCICCRPCRASSLPYALRVSWSCRSAHPRKVIR